MAGLAQWTMAKAPSGRATRLLPTAATPPAKQRGLPAAQLGASAMKGSSGATSSASGGVPLALHARR